MTAAVLFPHSAPTEGDLRRALLLFNSLTIGVPWHMEPPAFFARYEDSGLLRVLRPPADLLPREDFPALLAEFRRWVGENRERGAALFQWAAAALQQEDPVWRIRASLRGSAEGSSAAPGPEADEWHLALHLALQLEQQRRESEKALSRAKTLRSPLEGALEDPSPSAFLDDLPPAEPFLDEAQLARVMEAWFGLFGEVADSYPVLLTLDPFAGSAICTTAGERQGPGLAPAALEQVSLRVPDPSAPSFEGWQTARAALQAGEGGRAFAELVENLVNPVSRKNGGTARLAGAVEGDSEKTGPRLRLTLTCLPPLEKPARLFPAGLFGKVLVLLEAETS